MRKAVIVGSEGQDGTLLTDLLKQKDYSLIGIGRGITKYHNLSSQNTIDIGVKAQVFDLVRDLKPDEVYYLAAAHKSSEDIAVDDGDFFQRSYNVNLFYLIHFLEAIKKYSPATKLFYASSSHIFGGTEVLVQNEETPFSPNSIYGITKLDGLLACRYYRGKYGLFACSGILYNHESNLRKESFFSRKLIIGAIEIKNKRRDKMVLGDLSAEVDWGYAPDYVDAMHRMLHLEMPDDFIVATGKKHSVQDFVKITFEYLNLDWEKYVFEKPELLHRRRATLVGDPGKIKRTINWRPSVDFKGMIRKMLEHEGAQINE